MIKFRTWLKEAFKNFSVSDPLYIERLTAFKKLYHTAFIEYQKENYKNIQEIISLWIDQPYCLPINNEYFLPLTIDNYIIDSTKSITLTFVNGTYNNNTSSNYLDVDIKLQKIENFISIQNELSNIDIANIYFTNDIFILLNKMLTNNIYLLNIEKNKKITIILQHIITDASFHIIPQLIIKVGQASKVTLIENWHKVEKNIQSFVNNFTNIFLEKESHLDYYTLYTNPTYKKYDLLSYQINSIHCYQKDYSNFTHHSFSFNDIKLSIHISVQIKGSYAHVYLYGLSILDTIEQIDYKIQVIHSAPYSFSKQHYKSILGGSSISSFSGKIYLTPSAQKTNGYQINNVLLISEKAQHYTKPQLEIYADDVKCSHGATTGQIDENQLFYLKTRGIADSLAKRLLLEAFSNEIIHSVHLLSLQNYLYDHLIAKLIKL